LRALGVSDIDKIHAEVRRAEGERQEHDCYTRHDHNGFVVLVSRDRELVLLNGLKLEELFWVCRQR
jgi:hypothetical protein